MNFLTCNIQQCAVNFVWYRVFVLLIFYYLVLFVLFTFVCLFHYNHGFLLYLLSTLFLHLSSFFRTVCVCSVDVTVKFHFVWPRMTSLQGLQSLYTRVFLYTAVKINRMFLLSLDFFYNFYLFSSQNFCSLNLSFNTS